MAPVATMIMRRIAFVLVRTRSGNLRASRSALTSGATRWLLAAEKVSSAS